VNGRNICRGGSRETSKKGRHGDDDDEDEEDDHEVYVKDNYNEHGDRDEDARRRRHGGNADDFARLLPRRPPRSLASRFTGSSGGRLLIRHPRFHLQQENSADIRRPASPVF